MTSSMTTTASKASISITINDIGEVHAESKKNHNDSTDLTTIAVERAITSKETTTAIAATTATNSGKAQNTFNPITDLIQNNGRTSITKKIANLLLPATSTTATATATATTNSISKIPYPLVTTTSTNQFQRSASLRLRSSKKIHCNGVRQMEMKQNTNKILNNSNDNTTPTNSLTKGQNDTTTTEKHESNTHEQLSTTSAVTTIAGGGSCGGVRGHISTRRKLVLNNSYLPALGITRSLSLRTNFKFGHKTDANKELQNKVAAAPDNQLKALQLNDDSVDAEENQLNQTALDNAAAEADTNLTAPSDIDNCINTDDCTHINDVNAKNPATTASTENNQKMSVKQNGEITPTTPILATTTIASASSTSTATRPATLATNTNGTATASPTHHPKSTKTTPKTPTTTPQQQYTHYCQNASHQHHHCPTTKVGLANLSTVPETRKLTPKTPPVTPDSPCTYLDDDLDSMYSFATTTSGRSTMSCEHPYVARNGTTFSGRKMKYVVHCSNYAGQVGSDYLTPTQRAQRQIRRLKEMLCDARQDLEQKDTEILRLTREVVELRLFKASLSSPEERSASSDAVTVREAELKTSQDVSPIVDMVDDAAKASPRHLQHLQQQQQQQHHHLHHSQHGQQQHNEMQSSFADSGHFEDMTSMSVHSKDSSYAAGTQDIACGSDEAAANAEASSAENYELQRQELIRLYEQRIEDLIRNQDGATSELKRTHNDRIEALLQKLAECNTRYADIVPDYEHAKERIRELEKQLEELQRRLAEHEEKQNKMYLHMYQKGQEAERIARADQALELAHRAPNKVSINELLHQLQSTQDELENIRAAECRNECGSNHALLTAKEAISLWVLGARKTIYRRLLEAQKNRTHVDPEVTLQFLKSAVYYFLTDKENSQGHLQAIESILEFTEAEKQNINKARTANNK